MRRLLCAVSFLLLSASTLALHAATLAQDTAGTFPTLSSLYFGQSFTVAPGIFNNIAFSFYTPSATTYAAGTGFLFSSAYSGSPAGLNSGVPGFLGSALASGGAYSFASSLTLQGGVAYYFYENALFPTGAIQGGDLMGAPRGYFSSTPGGNFGPTLSANYIVTGTALSATPEPSSFLLLCTGVVGGLAALRRKLA